MKKALFILIAVSFLLNACNASPDGGSAQTQVGSIDATLSSQAPSPSPTPDSFIQMQISTPTIDLELGDYHIRVNLNSGELEFPTGFALSLIDAGEAFLLELVDPEEIFLPVAVFIDKPDGHEIEFSILLTGAQTGVATYGRFEVVLDSLELEYVKAIPFVELEASVLTLDELSSISIFLPQFAPGEEPESVEIFKVVNTQSVYIMLPADQTAAKIAGVAKLVFAPIILIPITLIIYNIDYFREAIDGFRSGWWPGPADSTLVVCPDYLPEDEREKYLCATPVYAIVVDEPDFGETIFGSWVWDRSTARSSFMPMDHPRYADRYDTVIIAPTVSYSAMVIYSEFRDESNPPAGPYPMVSPQELVYQTTNALNFLDDAGNVEFVATYYHTYTFRLEQDGRLHYRHDMAEYVDGANTQSDWWDWYFNRVDD